jgi:hypothetical protein
MSIAGFGGVDLHINTILQCPWASGTLLTGNVFDAPFVSVGAGAKISAKLV